VGIQLCSFINFVGSQTCASLEHFIMWGGNCQ